jgi:hypothetical protein
MPQRNVVHHRLRLFRRGQFCAGLLRAAPGLENGFCVLRSKMRGHRDVVTVVGHAATIAAEATGFEAKTIHRLLEVDPKGGGFKPGDDNPLDCDLLVVDETSMVDVMLMQALMKAAPDKAAF